MTAILPEMGGNAIRTSQFCQHGCCNWVGFYGSPRLPNCGDVIDIDAKCQHLRSSPELSSSLQPLILPETRPLLGSVIPVTITKT
jgi:hypothetical protein